ncbi:MAG: NADH-quinone oxidoreductase subunit L [Gammaproteobacteria bacterium]|nr:NADH-quinone oxidoreductase subunit L [Gammaproteobacteria bacterium]
MNLQPDLLPYLVLVAPLLLLLVGLVPSSRANRNPGLMARLNGAAAWAALMIALVAAVVHGLGAPVARSLFSVALPGDVGAFSISTYVNTVTVIMLVLVSFVGAVVSRYARNYLSGDRNQGRFHKWLSLTLAAILTLIVSGNLLMFAAAWIATSLFLHQLLMFYRERPAAVLSAHKKFVASRIGDLSLLGAVLLIGSTLHTLEFAELFDLMVTMDGQRPVALHWASVLVVVSAVLKSAQFPFHGWLIQVMEAPTPVSALLHAGIVNAGAFLVIRMSPVVSQSTTALVLLAVIGLVTLALASLVMLTQTSIKVSLAWSTTAQMGFMLLECGLGLYSLAMLHLVAHSLYKAHAFLASGSGVDAFRAPAIPVAHAGISLRRMAAAFGVAGGMTLLTAIAFGITVAQQPALIAAALVVTIAISQLLLQASSYLSSHVFLLRALGLSALVCGAYFALHGAFEHALVGSVVPVANPAGPLQAGLAALVVAVFIALMVLQVAFSQRRTSLTEAWYVHLYNGLYIDVYMTRWLQRLWPGPTAGASGKA